MSAFATRFASVGAREDQLQTCYAMAEAVFAVAQSEIGRPPVTLDVERAAFAEGHILPAANGATDSVRLTSTGRPLPGFALEVIDRDRRPVAAGRIGEIAISGPSVFNGYYKVASDALSADGRFATGDLGFLHEGELYITGRIKDLIIAYGKNFYSHDIEAVASRNRGREARPRRRLRPLQRGERQRGRDPRRGNGRDGRAGAQADDAAHQGRRPRRAQPLGGQDRARGTQMAGEDEQRGRSAGRPIGRSFWRWRPVLGLATRREIWLSRFVGV